jgi:hypothetical protein
MEVGRARRDHEHSAEDCRRHAGRYEYLVELDGREDDLPTPLRSSLLRSPLLAG